MTLYSAAPPDRILTCFPQVTACRGRDLAPRVNQSPPKCQPTVFDPAKISTTISPGSVRSRATAVLRQRTDLSVPDTFAFSLAAARGWALLTGHGTLGQLAITKKIEVYGVLWLFDQLEAGRLLPLRKLRDALTSISEDPRCRLPATEIKRRLSGTENDSFSSRRIVFHPVACGRPNSAAQAVKPRRSATRFFPCDGFSGKGQESAPRVARN
jgi:hypothetical protein